MRLPETFELKYACKNSVSFGLVGINDNNYEVSSNTPVLTYSSVGEGIFVPVLGGVNCDLGGWGWVAKAPALEQSLSFRCVR